VRRRARRRHRRNGGCGGMRFSLYWGADAAREGGSLTSITARAGSRKLMNFHRFLLLAHGS
jgi:hypothetical protein